MWVFLFSDLFLQGTSSCTLGIRGSNQNLIGKGSNQRNEKWTGSSAMYLWMSQKFPLEQIFRHKVLKMLAAKGKITQDMIMLLDKWRHTGFNVFFGPRILPRQEKSMETLARYIIRASFSQERMNYYRETGHVEYRSKDGKETKVFDALEWLAAMPGGAKPCEDGCSHVPNKGEQMARYYGFYSNVARGKRKKNDADDKISCFLEPELTGKTSRRNWARLIQKIQLWANPPASGS